MKRFTAAVLCCISLLMSLASLARQPRLTMDDVPNSLREWVPWVKSDIANYDCYYFECTWPSSLRLNITNGGATFEANIFLRDEARVVLPGSDQLWPENVTVDKSMVMVTSHNGLPTVNLAAGQYFVRGTFMWEQIPEKLHIAAETGIISLTVHGTPVEKIRREPADTIWIKERFPRRPERDHLSMEVFRRIRDDVPLEVTTQLKLHIAGKPREIVLNGVQLKDMQVIGISSSLPVRMNRNNAIVIQARAGSYDVTITSVIHNDVKELRIQKNAAPWPQREIWVFDADEQLRQVQIEGVPSLDSAQTDLPEDWKPLGAYIVSAGTIFRMNTTRRGDEIPPPDAIRLTREIWLDMDGSGMTVRDELTGTLNQRTRLNYEGQETLGHVLTKDNARVITEDPRQYLSGVELRDTSLQLTGVIRQNHFNPAFKAVGWNIDVNQLHAQLNLPPGWSLFATAGVDEVDNTWWGQWRLLEFLFILIGTIAVVRLITWQAGLLALMAFVSLHTVALPKGLMEIGTLVLLIPALFKQFHKGWPRHLTIAAFVLMSGILCTIVAPFLFHQLNEVLASQPEVPQTPGAVVHNETVRVATGSAADGIRYSLSASPKGMAAHAGILTHNNFGKPDALKGNRFLKYMVAAPQEAPMDIVQTGPGIPTFEWQTYYLKWNGPVQKNHVITLYLMNPAVHLGLAIVRAVLLIALIFILIRAGIRAINKPPVKRTGTQATVSGAAGVAGIVSVFLYSHNAAADVPSAAVLDALREKLAPSSQCDDECTTTQQVAIELTGSNAVVRCKVHAEEMSDWVLPGPVNNFVPSTITVDGKSAASRIDRSGYISILLSKGIHTVFAKGRFVSTEAPVLEFHRDPHRVSVSAENYTVDGIDEYGNVSSRLYLIPLQNAESHLTTEIDEKRIEPWLHVHREISFHPPWHAVTTVTRLSPANTPIQIKIPLVKDELVTGDQVKVKGHLAIVSMAGDQTHVSWKSQLKETSSISLKSPSGVPWFETWQFRCGPLWQCRYSGMVPVKNKIGQRLYKPWPGERVHVSLTRPKAVAGQHTTIDAVHIEVTPGLRATSALADLDIRSSRGGIKKITLPKGATVKTLDIDGLKVAFRQEKQTLDIPLSPKKQNVKITWEQQDGFTGLFSAPQLTLDSAATNASVSVNIPDNRWIVWTIGPFFGPKVLFWAHLLFIVVLAFVLGRLPFCPLKGWQWALLFIGLVQAPFVVVTITVAWFVAMAWRAKNPFKHHNRIAINLAQVGLVCMTVLCLYSVVFSVTQALLYPPDMFMHNRPIDSTTLNWYQDIIQNKTPAVTIINTPLAVWKTVMLLWTLWLAYNLIPWSKWAFRAMGQGGWWAKKQSDKPARERSGKALGTREEGR
ncbi:MAG: hypothetical protein JXR76_24705 [Deltaproteobacteria bacterium]|nr:hypothetical protein [Deltaproteobacteria bacterium]